MLNLLLSTTSAAAVDHDNNEISERMLQPFREVQQSPTCSDGWWLLSDEQLEADLT